MKRIPKTIRISNPAYFDLMKTDLCNSLGRGEFEADYFPENHGKQLPDDGDKAASCLN